MLKSGHLSDRGAGVKKDGKSETGVLSGDTVGSSTSLAMIEDVSSHQGQGAVNDVQDVTSSSNRGGESKSTMLGNQKGIGRRSRDAVSGSAGISSNGFGLKGGQKDAVEFVDIATIRREVKHDIAQLKNDELWRALCRKIKAMPRQKQAVFCLEVVVEIQKSQSIGYVNEIKEFRALYQKVEREAKVLGDINCAQAFSDSVFYTSNDFLYESIAVLAEKACSVDHNVFLSAWVTQFEEGGKNLTDREIQFIGQLMGIGVSVSSRASNDEFDLTVGLSIDDGGEGGMGGVVPSVTIKHCPGHYERIENLDGKRVALITEGDGYCALHAAFGQSMKDGGVQHAKGGGGQKARLSNIVKVSDLATLKSEIVVKAQALIKEMREGSGWSSQYPSFDALKKDVLALTYTSRSYVDEGYRRTLRALNLHGRIRQSRVQHGNAFAFPSAGFGYRYSQVHLPMCYSQNKYKQALISRVDQLVSQMDDMTWRNIELNLQLGVGRNPSILEQCVIHQCVDKLERLLRALDHYCQKEPPMASRKWNSVFSFHVNSLPARKRWFELFDLLLAKSALFTLLVGGMNKEDRLSRAANLLNIADDYLLGLRYNDLSVFVYVAWKNGECLPILSKDFTKQEIFFLLSSGLKAIERVIKREGVVQQPHFKGRFLYQVLQLSAFSGCDTADLASFSVYKKDVADYVISQCWNESVLQDKNSAVYRFLNITNGFTHPEESATIKKLKGEKTLCAVM